MAPAADYSGCPSKHSLRTRFQFIGYDVAIDVNLACVGNLREASLV